MSKSLNLILAFIWLALGIALLAIYWAGREAPGAWEYQGWAGSIAMAMAAYNLVRWWASRSRGQRPGVDWGAFHRRPRLEEPPDSGFQLTDEPPPVRLPPSTHIKSPDEPPPKT